LVTGWFRRHGIAYLDMVVAALDDPVVIPRIGDGVPGAGTVLQRRRDQYELAESIGYRDGFGRPLQRLDRVVMLLPAGASGLSDARVEDLVAPAKWQRLTRGMEHLGVARELDALRRKVEQDQAFPSLEWLEQHWRGNERLLWHVINEAPLAAQVEWYKKYSPLYGANKDRIQLDRLDVRDVEQPAAVTTCMHDWLEEKGRGDRLLVNLWGTATTVQFGWYYLAWRRPALKDAVFLKCWDDKKAGGDRRFAPISIEVLDKDPIGGLLRPSPRAGWESDERRNARGWLEFYLRQDDNFSILLLGERGTGKSEAVREAWKATGRGRSKAIVVNCADFRDPTHARSELFGHVKGAFTGANRNRQGLLERADGGLLFLDEVHHLDEETRSLLLTALQTGTDGRSTFAPLGGDRTVSVKFQPVFASNLGWAGLARQLKPDFLDRISQRVLQWPRIGDEELDGAWYSVWSRMDFKGTGLENPAGQDGFLAWLRGQPRPGNFRDLQRIAILVADYQRALAGTSAEKALVRPGSTLLEFLERGIPPQSAPVVAPAPAGGPGSGDDATPAAITVPFDLAAPDATDKTWLAACKREFAAVLKKRFGTQKAAVDELKRRGSKMTEARLSRWGKS
jgi:hypothetical protein